MGKSAPPYGISTQAAIWPWQYFTGKRWTFTCGACRWTWSEKLPVAEHISAKCPECGTRIDFEVEIGHD